jgi:hypothetical protein
LRDLGGSADIERALQAVGELLAAEGESYAIVVLGGAALSLRGIVTRTTRDVDIVAFASDARVPAQAKLHLPPKPLPPALVRAIAIVASDFGLDPGWLNTAVDLQMNAGLPGFHGRLDWRRYAALVVGVASPTDLVAFKLFAAADDGLGGRHVRDLVALRPTPSQLEWAAAWVKTQDANTTEFPRNVDQMVTHVRKKLDAADR